MANGPLYIVGVDPGGRSTGVCLRSNHTLLFSTIVERKEGGRIPPASYLKKVIASVRDACRVARDAGGVPLVAVEGLRPPIPHLGMANPTGLMGAAVVLGAILATWPGALVVEPSGHGSAPLDSYPSELVGPRETTGSGKRRHMRSAWDVAGAAEGELRIASLMRLID